MFVHNKYKSKETTKVRPFNIKKTLSTIENYQSKLERYIFMNI